MEISPRDAEGGGMMDIVSVCLRAGMLELYEPKQDGPLMLDEVDKFLADDDMVQAMGAFLKRYCETSGRQIIMVTHKAGVLVHADKHFEMRPGPNATCIVEASDE